MDEWKRVGIFAVGCVMGATSIFLLYLTFLEEPPVFSSKPKNLIKMGRSWCRVSCVEDPSVNGAVASQTDPSSTKGSDVFSDSKSRNAASLGVAELRLDPGGILQAPRFFESVPDVIHTDREGEAYVRWHEVKGAESYYVWLLDNKDQVVKKVRSRRTFVFLKEIPTDDETLEAQYKVRLSSINQLGKEGEPGTETRMLWAKNQTKVFAPKVKNIKVEE